MLTRDVNGHQILGEVDNNADDIVDARYTTTYDANGHLTLSEGDDNADGIVDERITAAYNADGHQITFTTDTDADSTIDSSYIYGYDANGNWTLYKYISADGSVDFLITYIYNADNKVTRVEHDVGADGAVELREDYYYDASGKLLMQERDAAGNRILSMIETDHDRDGTRDLNAHHFTYIRISKWRASGLAAPVSALWTGHPYFPE